MVRSALPGCGSIVAVGDLIVYREHQDPAETGLRLFWGLATVARCRFGEKWTPSDLATVATALACDPSQARRSAWFPAEIHEVWRGLQRSG